MLWRIRDFKGIGTAELDIGPGKATVLTGVNSSGKSSVIQSLLLVAQSLQSENNIVLNGPLVRLGDAQDLVREDSELGAIELTIGLEQARADDGVSELGLQAVYDLVPAEDRSFIRPRRLKIGTENPGHQGFQMGRENSRATDVALAMDATEQFGSRDVLHLKSLLDSGRRQLRTYVVVKGLRPVAVVQLMRANDVATRYRVLLDSLLHGRETGSTRAATAATARIGNAAMIREFVRLFSRGEMRTDAQTRTFLDARMGNPYAFDMAWSELDQDERQTLIERAVNERKQQPFVVLPLRGFNRGLPSGNGLLESQLIDVLGPTFEALNVLNTELDSIADRVQYLGPLRDEPRVVWNHWNELARGLPVGTRGEYSAAVLSRSGASQIRYSPPNAELTVGPLSEAVNQWLTYLQIGDTVAARSHGKLGVGLDLGVNGHVRDLTSVGVGVSQALPLLVGLLKSPSQSIFIVEQPELHLHPAVQARLADFMLNARRDLTLLIETHSEAFVTRIRRRVAEGLADTASIDVAFVEPGAKGSIARVLDVSEYGDLSEWPSGFLSTGEEDVRAIIQANIKRSKRATDVD